MESIKVNGAWQTVDKAYVKDQGVWKESTTQYMKIAGKWIDVNAMPTTFEATFKSPKTIIPTLMGGNGVVEADGPGQWKIKGYGSITWVAIVRDNVADSELITEVHITKMSTVTSLGGIFRADSKVTKLTSVVFDDNLDVSNVTSMEGIFKHNSKLTHVDFGNNTFDNVTNMQEAFSGCVLIENIDLSGFSSAKVDSFVQTFMSCLKLKCISSIDTTHAIRKLNMFKDTKDLTSPDTATQTKLTSSAGFKYEKGSPC